MSKKKKCFYPSRFLRFWKSIFSINFFNAVAHRIFNQVKRSSNSDKYILNPKSILLFVSLFIFLGKSIAAGSEPPLQYLYMKLLIENVRRTVENQSDDGGSPAIPINLAAYLYKTDHPLNPYCGDSRLLDLAIRGGDQLVKNESSNIIVPMNYWTLLPWIEALDLIKDSLSREQRVAWTSRIEHWVESYADYVKRSQGKREYTAVQLGSGTNHYSHYLVTVLWAGQALGHPEWVKLAKEEYKNLLRTQHPDGFWSEHHGPVNLYNRATTHGVGLYYALTGDPEALEVLRRAKDFILNFTYPDGSAVAVIDERNRYYPQIDFPWGLVGLSHFPDGRRYNRLSTKNTIERLENNKTGQKNGKSPFEYNLSSSDLSQILENLKYSATGDESPTPQEVDRYEARLMNGAILMRRGSWVICVSGIISPPWEGNRFFLDRYTYLEVWHRKTGLLIGGGNTKRQPQIAGLLMEPSHAGLDFWPQESRITTLGDTILLELSFEKFCARKKVAIIDDQTLKIKVDFTKTTPPILWPNRYECNLQLQLKAGQSFTAGSQEKITLSSQLVHLSEEQVGTSLETEFWCLEVPNRRTSLRFPFIPFNNYNIDGIGDSGSAVAIISSFTNEPDISLEYLLKIKP